MAWYPVLVTTSHLRQVAMIVSTHVFLILLLPLLIRGTPTPPNPSSEDRSLFHGITVSQFQMQRPHVLAGPQDYNTNPNVYVILDNYLDKTHCRLPKDSKYRTPPSPGFSYLPAQEGRMDRIGRDWVVITRQGDLVFLPSGTTITISEDPDHIRMPTGKTGIRMIAQDDPYFETTGVFPAGSTYRNLPLTMKSIVLKTVSRTPTSCVVTTPQDELVFVPAETTIIVSISDSPNRLRLPTGSGTGIRSIGDDDEYFQTTCIFPEGAQYTKQSAQLKLIKLTSGWTKSAQMVFTLDDGVFFLPKYTIVIVSKNHKLTRFPTGKTKIKKIEQKVLDRVTKYCNKVHERHTPKDGMQNEPLLQYGSRCFRTNVWHVAYSKRLTPVPVEELPRTINTVV